MQLTAPQLDSPPLERFGLPTFVRFTSPAAGADFSHKVVGNYFERFVSLHVKFVASATVASREVVVSFEDESTARFGLAGANTTITAGNTGYFEFSAFQPEVIATVDSSVLIPLPPYLLAPTNVLKIHVVSIDTTDQLSEIRAIRERFFTTGQPVLDG